MVSQVHVCVRACVRGSVCECVRDDMKKKKRDERRESVCALWAANALVKAKRHTAAAAAVPGFRAVCFSPPSATSYSIANREGRNAACAVLRSSAVFRVALCACASALCVVFRSEFSIHFSVRKIYFSLAHLISAKRYS